MIYLIILILIFLVSKSTSSIFGTPVDSKVISKILVNYDHLISLFSTTLGVPKRNIYAIIAVESGGDPDLPTGLAGEVGLMQITKPALDDINRLLGTPFTMKDLKAPYANILIGTGYWKRCYNYYSGQPNQEDLAFRAYNAGFTGVERGKSNNYLNKIKSWLKLIVEMGI